MVFGLEQIGRFFDWITLQFMTFHILIKITMAFLIFVALNGLFIYMYFKIIHGIANVIPRIRYLIKRIEEWLE